MSTRALVGALVIVSIAVTSCGDAAGTYVDEVGAIIDTMRSDSLAATPRAGAVTREGVVGVNEARRAAALALTGLTPPDDIRPEHLVLVAALDDLVAGVDAFLTATADLDGAALSDAATTASDLQNLASRVGWACQTLDRRLADLGFEAHIRC